jgi:hypothetical protein
MKPTQKIFLMIMSIVLIPFLAQADFPVSYQGKLANTEGVPISGTVSNTISLYTLIEGGEAVWSESHDNVKVENGILNVILGISTDQSQSLFDTLSMHDTLYYSVSINHSEIKPRSRITGVMFAIRAKIADTVKDLAITSDKIKPDAVTSDKIASNAVTELKIEDGAVSSEKIQDDAISSQKIQDGAVTVQKISDADGNLSLNNELKVNKGISIKELPPNYSPPAEQGYGKIYAKKGNSSLRQDIIFNWRLDERTGDHIDDAIGFCDATAYSNLTVVPGKLGMAKIFDGQTNYIQENNNTDLNFGTDNFSVSFWMKAERPSGWSAIMSKANDWIESKDVCGWLFGNRDSGSDTLEFRINSCGQDKEHRITHAENVFNNEWHHIVGIRDGEIIKLYVDGVLKDTALNVTQSVHVDEPFLIGSVINKYFYSGVIDEVAIWKKVLEDDEISDLFNQGNGAAIPDELARLYYKNSDGSETPLAGNLKELLERSWKKSDHSYYLEEGNYGIGIKRPAQELVVYKSADTADIQVASGTEGRFIDFFIQPHKGGLGGLWMYGEGDMVFGTYGNEKVRIKQSGNVGIGTTNPLAPLVVNTTYNMPPSSVKLQQWQLHDDRWYLSLYRNHQSIGHVSWDFVTREDNSSSDKVALSLKSGNVGIGASNPLAPLVVNTTYNMPSSSVKLQQWQLHDDRWYLSLYRNHQSIGHVSWDFVTREDNSSSDKVALSLKSGNVGIGTSNPLAPIVVNTTYNMPSSSVKLQQWQLHEDRWYLALHRNHQSIGHVSWDFITREEDETTDKVALSLKSGNVGIGKVNPTCKLDVAGGIQSTNLYQTSDIRFKKDIKKLNYSLDSISKLNSVSYHWKAKEFPEKNFSKNKQIGFIAQEVETVMPEIVHTDKEGFKSIAYDKLTVVLVQAMQEIKRQNENLIDKVSSLEEEIQQLKANKILSQK